MRPSSWLLQQACRITLFTNPKCSLCDTAKGVLSKVQTRRPFELRQINIHEPDQEYWRNQYAFDTPVIHVEKADAAPDSTVDAAQKLMHRFSIDDVEAKMDQIIGNQTAGAGTSTT